MVKCADCGFLALREWETRSLVDAETTFRETGREAPVARGALHKRFEDQPLCFVRAIDMDQTIKVTSRQVV